MRISDWSSDVCSSDLETSAHGCHEKPGMPMSSGIPSSEHASHSISEMGWFSDHSKGQNFTTYNAARKVSCVIASSRMHGIPFSLLHHKNANCFWIYRCASCTYVSAGFPT